MRRRVSVAKERSPSVGLTRGFALLSAVGLAAVALSAPVHASHRDPIECPEGDTACIAQRGDNDSDADVGAELSGGDGVAGGQVIGGAGISGDVTINARNNSEFSRARGGDADFDLDLKIDSGPKIEITRGDVDIEANATGTSGITQTATSGGGPSAAISLVQFNSPTGSPLITNTAVALAAVIFNGAGPVTQTGKILQVGDNDSDFDLDLTLAGGDAVAGAQVIGLAGVTGSANIDASNQSRFATARGGDSNADVDADLDSGPEVKLTDGNVRIVVNAEGAAPITNTAALP